MKPNYKNYSYKSLLEALNSIDKNAYPERVVEIKSRIQQWFETTEFNAQYQDNNLAMALFVLTVGLIGVYGFLYGNPHDIRRYGGPILLVTLPFIYWSGKKKFKVHQKDVCKIDQTGVFRSEKNTENTIVWQAVKRAGFVTIKGNTTVWFENQNQQREVAIELNLFDLDSTEVLAFVNFKAKQYGFELFEIGGLGQEKVVIAAKNSQKIETQV